MDDGCVRCAETRDAEEWMALAARLADNFPGLVLADYRATLNKNIARGTALCVVLDGVLAGVLLYSPKLTCISCMAVAPEFRRRGVGSALVAAALNAMPNVDVMVTTFREGDPLGAAPRALYAKFGFEPGETTQEFGHDAQKFIRKCPDGGFA